MTDTVPQHDSRRWLMLPVVLLAMFMAGVDIWAVNERWRIASAAPQAGRAAARPDDTNAASTGRGPRQPREGGRSAG